MWKTLDTIACHLRRYHRRKWPRHATGRWISVVSVYDWDFFFSDFWQQKKFEKLFICLLNWFNAKKHDSRMKEKHQTDHFDSLGNVVIYQCILCFLHVLLSKAFDRKSQDLDSISLLVQTLIVGWQWRKFPGYSLDRLSPSIFILFP